MIQSKERVAEYYDELNKPITINELKDMLNLTIRCDENNKVITFLTMLLTYTDSDQINLAFNAESSSGKSYIPLEVAEYFPQEDVMRIAYCSPTAFFHEFGEWDEEQHIKRIDLSRKILIFLDMPHDQLLQRLRPLLSHDRKELLVKITDRSKARGLATKQALLIGFMTAVYCSTRYSLDNQERTRCIMLSPEIKPEKIRQALELISLKQSNQPQYKEYIEASKERLILSARTQDVKNAFIEEVIIPEDIREEILTLFMEKHSEHLTPRLTRDFPRLFGLVKACALLNLHHRERVNNHLVANATDMIEALTLYESVSRANELGIPPEALDFYEEVLLPETHAEGYANKKDLSRRYYEVRRKTIGRKRLDATLNMLLECGLIVEDKDPEDRRITVYSPIQEIYTPRPVTKPEINTPQGVTKLEKYTPEGVTTQEKDAETHEEYNNIPEYNREPALEPSKKLVTPPGVYISQEEEPSP